MAIASEEWSAAAFDDVVLAFLKAEWHKYPADMRAMHAGLVDTPSLLDAQQNELRMKLLNGRRKPLLASLPADTQWFRVCHLRGAHLSELRVINDRHWNSPGDSNELPKVALRTRLPLASHPDTWAAPVLWGHAKSGPFTILEGNNRLAALAAASPPVDFQLPVFIGLSSAACRWHRPDGATAR